MKAILNHLLTNNANPATSPRCGSQVGSRLTFYNNKEGDLNQGPGPVFNQGVEPLLYTLGDVAQRLRCSEKTVRRMIDSGEIIAKRVRNRWMVTPEDLVSYVQNLKPSKTKGGLHHD